MISKLPLILLFAALLLCGCDHHKAANQNSANAVPSGDSELTGIPPQPLDSVVKTPPRAALVALPPGYSTTPAASAAPTAKPPTYTKPSTPAPTNIAENPAPAAVAETPSAPPPVTPTPTEAAAPPASNPVPDSMETTPTPSTTTTAPETAPVPPPSAPAANQSQLVVIETSSGRIVIELDDFAAPKTCKNFRQLIQDGFYNNTVFHRVIPNFIIQGGDPQSKSSATNRDTYGLGGPGYTLPPEIELKHDRGAVAMARLPDAVNPKRESNGSQFYICLAPCPSLDDEYTVFGHVVQGLEVADKIAEAPRDKRDNPRARIEMNVRLESKDQALGAGSAASP